MRIADMGDMSTWREGRRVKVGNWSFRDSLSVDGEDRLRDVYHYGTNMATLYVSLVGGWGEGVCYLNVGHGSVSDQGGMNQVLARCGSAIRYRRDWKGGGPRYESTLGRVAL